MCTSFVQQALPEALEVGGRTERGGNQQIVEHSNWKVNSHTLRKGGIEAGRERRDGKREVGKEGKSSESKA